MMLKASVVSLLMKARRLSGEMVSETKCTAPSQLRTKYPLSATDQWAPPNASFGDLGNGKIHSCSDPATRRCFGPPEVEDTVPEPAFLCLFPLRERWCLHFNVYLLQSALNGSCCVARWRTFVNWLHGREE
jgi:hypothetical protein